MKRNKAFIIKKLKYSDILYMYYSKKVKKMVELEREVYERGIL